MEALKVTWFRKTFSAGSAFVLPAGYILLEQCLNNEDSTTLRIGYLAPCDLENFKSLVGAVVGIAGHNNDVMQQCLKTLENSGNAPPEAPAGPPEAPVPVPAAAASEVQEASTGATQMGTTGF
jgi:hypothetical protein